jgi:hypothetical protein
MNPSRSSLGLVVLVLCLVMVSAASTASALQVANTFSIRDHVGPNTVGSIPGDRLVLGAVDVTPAGPPTTAAAVQGDRTLALSFIPLTLFPNQYVASIAYDPALTGAWTIDATRDTETASATTNAIPNPQLLPLVNELRVVADVDPLTPTVTWELPELSGFDVTRIRIRVVDAFNGNQLVQLAPLAPTATSVHIPPATLHPGRAYVFRVMLEDVSAGFLQNRSNTFSAPYVVAPLSGLGTAVIDGVFSPGEWDRAARLDVPVLLPRHDGGGAFTATVYVMNDAQNLYLALRAPLAATPENLLFTFDNDNDRVFVEGHDALGLSPASELGDWYYTTQSPCQPGFFCLVPDEFGGGRADGSGAVGMASDHVVYELAHPLDTGDPLDFALHAGDEVGFRVQYSITSRDAGCASDCFAGRLYPLAGTAVIRVAADAAGNRPPHADAGEPLEVREGTMVFLDGRASFDPDGDPLTYQWTQVGGPGVVLVDAETATPSFTAPLLGGGIGGGETLTFRLIVSDGTASAEDDVAIVVVQSNHAPVADAGAPQTARSGRLVVLDGSRSRDDDGDAITYQWLQIGGPGVQLEDAVSVSPSFTTPPVPGPTPLTFRLVVSDSALSGSADVVVTVVNDQPQCGLARPVPAMLWPPDHKLVRIEIAGVTDPDDDRVTLAIVGVTSDEPVTGRDDATTPDAVVADGALRLRAERSGGGNGRVYQVTFAAEDGMGGQCHGAVRVGVPPSLKPPATIVDDGQRYDATAR